MAYADHFRLVDDVAVHFDGVVASVDPFLQSRYVGFYAVAAAAVMELAVKEIMIEYAKAHHPLFGEYCRARYERINGRVGFDDLCKEHLKSFGSRPLKTFKRIVRFVDYWHLKHKGYSVKKAYENLLTCRHAFAHEGHVPEQTAYSDIKQSFESGKIMLACLAKALRMKRTNVSKEQ
ncbi:MAG: HEPN domain-containing protein [Sinimarinibacterium sp.]|jgi:hypothetical protein